MYTIASAHSLLRQCWYESLPTVSVQPAVWFCHRRGQNDEEFVAYGGLQAARESLMDLRRNQHAPNPILVFGFQEETLVRSQSDDHWPGSERLLDWPGAAYLRYDANVETLRVTAERIRTGAEEPLPEGLLHDPVGLLRLSEAIRHWLGKNRRIIVKSMLEDFRSAAHNLSLLSPYYLNPSPLAEQHQLDMRRLVAYQGATGMSEPSAAKLSSAWNSIMHFANSWEALEAAKAALRASTPTTARAPSENTLACIQSVLDALDDCITTTLALDTALLDEKGKASEQLAR